MFTGIVEGLGRVLERRATSAACQLVIDLGELAEGVALGDSVAVDGVCLTATALSGAQVSSSPPNEKPRSPSMPMRASQ